MKTKNLMIAVAVLLVIYTISFILPTSIAANIISVKKISGKEQFESDINPLSPIEKKEPLWVPPHLISEKDASPREIWLKDNGIVPESATVTLTVEAVGDPFYKHAPLDVVLCMDVTGSMTTQYQGKSKLDWTKEAAINFLDCLDLEGDDRAALVVFSSYVPGYVQLIQPFTNNKTDMNFSINSMTANGNTPFRDAVAFTVDYANKNHWPVGHAHPHAS